MTPFTARPGDVVPLSRDIIVRDLPDIRSRKAIFRAPSVYGKMSTILQMSVLSLTIAVNAFAPWIPPPFVQRLLPLVALLYRASMLMTLISGWHYLNRGRQILRELSPAAA